MVRKLRHHEQALLRKVSLAAYPDDPSHRRASTVRRYGIQRPEDYIKYNRVCGQLRQLAHRLSRLDPTDPVRHRLEEALLEKLWNMGVLGSGGGGRGKLSDVEHKVTVSAFARRRLPVVMTRLRMCETVQTGIRFIEQGHVRVGPEVVTDPAYLVTRNIEDFVTWVDSSKIKRNVLRYRDKLDDFDLL
ncbi:MAG: Small subunit (SSU) processome component [Sarcosagium campestre]|nr:MAG: Small subunit (SSU) processome component [Sarcosagium campestre]